MIYIRLAIVAGVTIAQIALGVFFGLVVFYLVGFSLVALVLGL